MITLFILIQLKHFIIDWILQPKYMYANKGTYMHPGGLLHAVFNALGTTLCFAVLGQTAFLGCIFIIDFLIHYHIDWCKVNINRYMDWKPQENDEFWWLTGFDQFLHQLTYILLVKINYYG